MSDIKLAWNAKQKQRELTKNQFFFSLFFFLKVQVIRKSKTPVIERESDKKCLGQVLTMFHTSPNALLLVAIFRDCSDTIVRLYDFGKTVYLMLIVFNQIKTAVYESRLN